MELEEDHLPWRALRRRRSSTAPEQRLHLLVGGDLFNLDGSGLLLELVDGSLSAPCSSAASPALAGERVVARISPCLVGDGSIFIELSHAQPPRRVLVNSCGRGSLLPVLGGALGGARPPHARWRSASPDACSVLSGSDGGGKGGGFVESLLLACSAVAAQASTSRSAACGLPRCLLSRGDGGVFVGSLLLPLVGWAAVVSSRASLARCGVGPPWLRV